MDHREHQVQRVTQDLQVQQVCKVFKAALVKQEVQVPLEIPGCKESLA